MPYSPTDVLNKYVKSDGTKCNQLSDIMPYLAAKTYRKKFSDGPTAFLKELCPSGDRVIDVVAIGIEHNWLRTGQYDPIVMSLNLSQFDTVFKTADKTYADTNDNYYSNGQPAYLYYGSGIEKLLPSINVAAESVKELNPFLVASDRTVPFCGAHTSATGIDPTKFDYWNPMDKDISNYTNDATNQNKGIGGLNYLLYATELVDHLQTRFGYRVMDVDPYNWANWLCISANGNGGTGSRYLKLMFLTEFDFYVHSGIVDVPDSIPNKSLIPSSVISSLFNNIIDPLMDFSVLVNYQYYNSNVYSKGENIPAGQFIYSRDYKYKLHLRNNGTFACYKFPITNDNLDNAASTILYKQSYKALPGCHIPCFVALQNDSNVVMYVNGGTNVAVDNGILTALAGFNWTTKKFESDGVRNGVITAIGNLAYSYGLTPPLQGFSDNHLYKICICRTPISFMRMCMLDKEAKVYSPMPPLITTGPTALGGTGVYPYNYMMMQNTYKVLVQSGGAIVSVNAGLKTLSNNEVGYVNGADKNNWMYTDDPNEPKCIHGWRYVTTTNGSYDNNPSQSLSVSDQIMNITKLKDTKNWCYVNPFLMYVDHDGTNYKFAATDKQQILWYTGPFVSTADALMDFINSTFLQQTFASALPVSDKYLPIVANYCLRGDRMLGESKCRTLTRAMYDPSSKLQSNPELARYKKLIENDINKRVCAAPIDKNRAYCQYVNPTNLLPVETLLLAADPKFSKCIGNFLVSFPYDTSTDSYMTDIKNVITANASKLSIKHLLYLRKFYSLSPGVVTAYSNNLTVYQIMISGIHNGYETDRFYIENGNYYANITNRSIIVKQKSNSTATNKWISNNQDNTGITGPEVDAGKLVLDIKTGNAILYYDSSMTKIVWSTNLPTKTYEQMFLGIDKEGNLVVYAKVSYLDIAWTLIWASNGVANYPSKNVYYNYVPPNMPLTNPPTTTPLDAAVWHAMYRTATNLSPIYTRLDLSVKSIPQSIVVYKSAWGFPVSAQLSLDTNIILTKGSPLTSNAKVFDSSDVIWKYLVGYVDMFFPTQLQTITLTEAMTAVSESISKMLTDKNSPYEQQNWTMTYGVNGVNSGNVFVFRLISDKAAIPTLKGLGLTLKDAEYATACSWNVDSCVADYGQIISAPNVDLKSTTFNTICDLTKPFDPSSMAQDGNYKRIMANYSPTQFGFGADRNTAIVIVGKYMSANNISGGVQGLTDRQLYAILSGSVSPQAMFNGGYASSFDTTKDTMNSLCINAYGSQKCATPAARYSKTGFTNKEKLTQTTIKPKSKALSPTVYEHFSGGSCIDICDDNNASAVVKEACKKGSLSYCGLTDNIYGPSCSTDMDKYPELSDIKNNWCANNPNHPNYSAHCDSQLQKATSSIFQTIANSVGLGGPTPSDTELQKANDVNVSEDEKDVPVWLIVLLVIIGVILLSAIGYGTYRFIKWRNANRKIVPMKQPMIQPMDQPMNQPMDQPMNQPMNQPMDQPMNQPMNLPPSMFPMPQAPGYLSYPNLPSVAQSNIGLTMNPEFMNQPMNPPIGQIM